LQNLASARSLIKLVGWLSPTDNPDTNTYQVRITNNNDFDLTLTQLTINVVDGSGNQVASNTIAPQIVVQKGSSVTVAISVPLTSAGQGANIVAIIATPFGQLVFGNA
jgi:LEA14-like dessication related protein